ncbi:MAG: hypothetical protein R3Y13_01595 [bacterium]
MCIESGDVIEFNASIYMIMDCGFFEGKSYAFLNKLDEEKEATLENIVVELIDNNIVEVSDEVLNVVVPRFVNRLMETV